MRNVIKVVKDAIEIGHIVGLSIIIAKQGEVLLEHYAGWANREQQQPITKHTLFRLGSMTKPIISATAMVLIEQGILSLDAPITNWLPKFTPKSPDGTIAPITIRHLLTHTSGLAYGFLFGDNEPYLSAGISDGMDESVLSLDENLKRLSATPLLFNPGSSWCYSLSTDVLGAVLEKAIGQDLPSIVERYITKPLGMKDTSFRVGSSKHLARAYADKLNIESTAHPMQEAEQILLEGCGYIHYAPSRITNPKAYPSGGTGMIGNARDYLVFLEKIRQGGGSILNSKSIDCLTQDHVPGFDIPAAGPGFGFSMGFAIVRDPKEACTPQHTGSYEWGGVYGTKMFVDPKEDLTVVILTNTALYGLMEFPKLIIPEIYNWLAKISK